LRRHYLEAYVSGRSTLIRTFDRCGSFLGAVEQSPYGVIQIIRSKGCSKKRATSASDRHFIRRFIGEKNSAYLGPHGFESCDNFAGMFIVQDGICYDDVNRPQMFSAVTHGLICAIGFQNAVAETAQYQSQPYEMSWLTFD
jgi:hypothetical protein